MDRLLKCLSEDHEVVTEVLQPWYLTCAASLDHDELGDAVLTVGASHPRHAETGAPVVLSWRCETCDASGGQVDLDLAFT